MQQFIFDVHNLYFLPSNTKKRLWHFCMHCPSHLCFKVFFFASFNTMPHHSVLLTIITTPSHSLHEKLFDVQAHRASLLVIFTSPTQFYRPELFFYHKGFKECMTASNIN